MDCAIYNYTLCDKKVERIDYTRPQDKKLRLKELQHAYWTRRGFFFFYRKKVAIKIGVNHTTLSHITSVKMLDDFCAEYLRSHNISVGEYATGVLLSQKAK
jgi:hypothetical protein